MQPKNIAEKGTNNDPWMVCPDIHKKARNRYRMVLQLLFEEAYDSLKLTVWKSPDCSNSNISRIQ